MLTTLAILVLVQTAVLIALNIGDVLSTMACLRFPTSREANPIIYKPAAWLGIGIMPVLIAYKVAVLAIMLAAVWTLRQYVWIVPALIALNGLYVYVVAHNIALLKRLKASAA